MNKNNKRQFIIGKILVILITGLIHADYASAELDERQSIDLDKLSSFPINGVLGDIDSITFSLSESEAMLIDVKQINSFLKLVLFNSHDELIFEVGLPTKDWIGERILVLPNDCFKCKLQIHPREKVDQSGKYQLSAKRLNQESDATEIEFESKMTLASVMWFKAARDINKLEQVYKVYLQAIELSEKLDSTDAMQRSLYLGAQVAHWSGNVQNLIKLSNKVINANENLHDRYRLRAVYLLAELARENDQIENSLQQLKMAQGLAIAQSDNLMLASIKNQLGLIAGDEAHTDKADKLFEESYKLFMSSGDIRKTIDGLINQGWSVQRRGRKLEKALNFYQQAKTLAHSVKSLSQEIDATFRIGEVYNRIGESAQANYYIEDTKRQLKKLPPTLLTGRVWQAKAKILFDTGMFELAKDLFEEAMRAYIQVKSKPDEMNILFYLGRINSDLGEIKKAKCNFVRVLEYDLETGNQYNLSKSYHHLAEASLVQKKYKDALFYQKQALDNYKGSNAKDEYFKGQLYSQAGIIFFYNGKLNDSENHLRLAKKIQIYINDYNGQIETGYRFALLQSAQGNNNQALSELNIVIKIIQEQRDNIVRADVKRSYYALLQKIPELRIKLLFNANADALEMLEVAELFRYQTLIERLNSLKQTRTVPVYLSQQRSQIQQELQSFVREYHELSDQNLIRNLLKKIRDLTAQYQSIEAKIGELNEVSRLPLASIKNTQNSLDSNILMLYFDTNPDESYLWMLTKQTVNVYKLPGNEIIGSQVKKILNIINNSPNGTQPNRRYSQKVEYEKLSRMLFSNVSINWAQFQKVIIIADGPLNFLPFSLLSAPGQQRSFLESKQISYAPSLTVYTQLSDQILSADQYQNINEQNRILLFAYPEFKNKNDNLPYTKIEADIISKYAGKNLKLLSQRNATKQMFVEQPHGDFQIIHLATHAKASSETISLNYLKFSDIDTSDNLLLAPDIASLKLNSELVVLSGCETALGRLIDGEGLQGLSRTFFENGAKRIVASLWKVRDKSTAELMGVFYKYLLQENQSPAEALRLAKYYVKNYQDQNGYKPWSDPYYWAGFLLQGNGESW